MNPFGNPFSGLSSDDKRDNQQPDKHARSNTDEYRHVENRDEYEEYREAEDRDNDFADTDFQDGDYDESTWSP